MNCLFLSNIYPDASASAAGARTQSLMKLLSQDDGTGKRRNIGYATTTTTSSYQDIRGNDNVGRNVSKREPATPATTSSSNRVMIADENDSFASSVHYFHLPPNRSNAAQDFFQTHPSIDTVIFDRFYMEEAFSFAVRKHLPKDATSLVLDMQDMHSLRWGRQRLVQEFDSKYNIMNSSESRTTTTTIDPFECLAQVRNYIPSLDDDDDTDKSSSNQLLRELASIHRCDLTLVCSPYELDLLTSAYQIPQDKLCAASFFVPQSTNNDATSSVSQENKEQQEPAGDSSIRFVFYGGFRHAPNVDAVRILIRYIWPRIRAQLKMKAATLHIYGAYCTQEIYQYHSPTERGIFVHGFTPSWEEIFAKGILLAPLRFGAGIKGKIVDAWTFGMPVVTTPIGSEGMTTSTNSSYDEGKAQEIFGGRIASTIDDFVQHAVELAVDKEAPKQAQDTGKWLLQELYDERQNWIPVQSSLQRIKEDLSNRRQTDFAQAMLWHQANRSTEYFSKWIELKETARVERGNAGTEE